jgi:hypothetical protein
MLILFGVLQCPLNMFVFVSWFFISSVQFQYDIHRTLQSHLAFTFFGSSINIEQIHSFLLVHYNRIYRVVHFVVHMWLTSRVDQARLPAHIISSQCRSTLPFQSCSLFNTDLSRQYWQIVFTQTFVQKNITHQQCLVTTICCNHKIFHFRRFHVPLFTSSKVHCVGAVVRCRRHFSLLLAISRIVYASFLCYISSIITCSFVHLICYCF